MKYFALILSVLILFSCHVDPKNIEDKITEIEDKLAETDFRKFFSPFAKESDPLDSLAQRAHDIESDVSVKQLKKDIEKQTKILNSALLSSQNLGRTYYLLGLKFLDYQMYGQAMQYFQQALEYYPEKPELFYNIGVAAGWMSDAQAEPGKRKQYLDQARFNLERALKLMPNYATALLALAVLYSYSFNMPYEAKALIKRYKEIEVPSTTSLFVEAHIAAQTMDEHTAIEIYTDLSSTANTPEERAKAAENRNLLLGR